jgi:formate hydrogenlyase subunit 6/NADH:ubiquinone oxidoreductase subunit I
VRRNPFGYRKISMRATIYYFTGTGNSLAIARQLAAALGETTLVPIPRALESKKPIRAPKGAVGFSFPVYCAGLPKMVARFAEIVSLADADYLFCACTMGGTGATGAFAELDRILARQRRKLDACFGFVMPSNFIDEHDIAGRAEQQALFAGAAEKVKEAAAAIREYRRTRDTEHGFRVLFLRMAHPFFIRQTSTWDKRFSVDDTCTGCTACEKICPAANIVMQDQRPVWLHRCEMCYACVNFCPKKSIQTGDKSRQRGRYRHPDVTVRDMLEQHGRKPDLSSLKNR